MPSHNLLVLSDVHLGSDLIHRVRPDAPAQDPASDRRDAQLVRLLDWYRVHPHSGLPWRLVIAGDLVDFVGMSVAAPEAGTATPLDAEDAQFGLGSAEDHALYKLRCVARRHRVVFESLARFVAEGNTLVVVRGNHDIDFHWPAVQDEFLRQLSLHAPLGRGSVEFSPWFYWEEGRVYVEHGHQYDRYCASEHLLHPVSPRDPRRSARSLSDVLLRTVVRPTRGMVETGHDRAGAADYLAFAVGLGVSGMLGLASRFGSAVATLLAIWRDHLGAGAARIRQHHDRRMGELSTRLGIGLETLRALASFQRPPVTRSFVRLALTVMLDRVAFAVFVLLVAAVAFTFAPRVHALGAVAIAVGLVVLASALLSRTRHDIDPTGELRDGATRVARLFPAAFVVMGHTHLPEVSSVGGPSTYVNLGAWSDAEGAGSEAPMAASRTHFVLRVGEDGASAGELLVWDAETGPKRFVSGAALPPPAGADSLEGA